MILDQMALGDETAFDITLRVLSESSIVPDIANSNATTVPSLLINEYAQFLRQSSYLPVKTGRSYAESLLLGGFLPYDGKG